MILVNRANWCTGRVVNSNITFLDRILGYLLYNFTWSRFPALQLMLCVPLFLLWPVTLLSENPTRLLILSGALCGFIKCLLQLPIILQNLKTSKVEFASTLFLHNQLEPSGSLSTRNAPRSRVSGHPQRYSGNLQSKDTFCLTGIQLRL